MFEALGHYRILDRIGTGGIGEVYRARDTRHGRTTAIKIVAREIAANPDRRQRFLLDAQAAAALSHPNIAALYEIGEDQNELFLVFEFVPGEPLDRVIGGRPLNPRRAVDFAAQVADALAEAHAHAVVHRDITPENIIITPKEKAKILDFGLAAWTRGGAARTRAAGASRAAMTAAAAARRTLAYLSPEQARGDPVDHRTDIFSAATVLFEMLTGRQPFAASTADALIEQIVQARPVAPSTITSTVPQELDTVVARALAKHPDERYESAATLSAELRQVAALLDARTERSDSSGRSPLPVLRNRRGSRIRWIVLAAVAAVLAAAAFCVLPR